MATLFVLVAALPVFWRTAYPTITWWDSSSYSLAAATLGVSSAPGSLLLTLLGWPVSRLWPGASTAHALNVLAGVLAACTAMLVYVVAQALQRASTRRHTAESLVVTTSVALGALSFAFSNTLWEYGVQFTPYVLSALFTALILWALAKWWEDADQPNARRRLLVLGLLFGLDFSVHRTNALLLPGALAWILIRSPRTLTQWRALFAGVIGVVTGLTVHLLIIPIAAFSRSPFIFDDPSNWSRFLDYITLSRLGGGFLIQLFPRKADLWSVQLADVLRVIGVNFFHASGPAGVLGLLPGAGAVFGVAALWRANRRLAAAFLLLFVLQIVATVLYFNIPAEYFRSLHRHYLPICVTIGVLVAYGFGSIAEWTARQLVAPRRAPAVLAALTIALVGVLLAPLAQVADNWRARNASNRYFAHDWAANALQTLPANAIYFTVGDNDTFPVMYLQAVEGVRRDVTIINLSVVQIPRYVERMRERDPAYPLSGGVTHLDLAKVTGVSRPVTYATTIRGTGMEWPSDFARLEGLHWQITARRDPPPDLTRARANLLEEAQYRGFADPSVEIDDTSRVMAFQYYGAWRALLDAELAAGEIDRCRRDLKTLFTLLPPERLDVPVDYLERLKSACGS